jgi:Tfp pilus assembly protein PilZ
VNRALAQPPQPSLSPLFATLFRFGWRYDIAVVEANQALKFTGAAWRLEGLTRGFRSLPRVALARDGSTPACSRARSSPLPPDQPEAPWKVFKLGSSFADAHDVGHVKTAKSGRVFERRKLRIPCVVRSDQQHHSGIVVDVSPHGLFIQTSAQPSPGDALHVVLSVPGDPHQLHLEVEVVRSKTVPPQLRSMERGGVGVRITSAPEKYFTLMERLHIEGDRG